MTSVNERCLDAFPSWLRTLASDSEALLEVLEASQHEGVRQAAAAGINYLFKSLDLIPDGIDEIGYLDDAFVLRVSADLMVREDSGTKGNGNVSRLAGDCDLLREFLGSDYRRLETYVTSLRRGAARGRTVSDIALAPDVLKEFAADVRSFARGYQVPSFSKDERNLIKLKAFFEAKLPR